MDWIKLLKTLLTLKKFAAAGDTVAKLYAYSQKIDRQNPQALDWDKLQFIQNKELAATRVELAEVDRLLDQALSKGIQWPDSGGAKAYAAAMKTADKHGKDAKETKAALDAYRRVLAVFDVELKSAVRELGDAGSVLTERAKAAAALAAYALRCRDAFLAVAKVPTFAGTAQNALFLSMSQDCEKIGGSAGRAAQKLQTLAGRTREAITEGKALIDQNQAWLDWALRDAMKTDDALKRNERAVKPR